MKKSKKNKKQSKSQVFLDSTIMVVVMLGIIWSGFIVGTCVYALTKMAVTVYQ